MAVKKTSKIGEYKVIPRTDSAGKEGFILVNGRPIRFDVPVKLADRDVQVLKGMKEPMQVDVGVDVNKIMDQMQVNQEKANQIARARMAEPEMQKKLRFVPRFEVIQIA